MADVPARLVHPTEARKGTFLKSFDLGQMTELVNYLIETKKAQRRLGVEGELVYTAMIGLTSRKSRTWQVFLLP